MPYPKRDPATGEYWYRGKWYESYGEVEEAIEEYSESYDRWCSDECDRRKDEKYLDDD